MSFPLLAMACLLAAPAAEGEELAGHRFLVPLLQDSSFVVTSVTSRFGFAGLRAPSVPLGSLGRQTLTSGEIGQHFEVMVRLHPIVALFVQADGAANTGITTQTIIVRTGELQADAHIGGIIRILRSESTGTQVSARLRAGIARSERLGLLPLLSTVTGTSTVPTETVLAGRIKELVLVPTTDEIFRGSLHAAQRIAPLLSIQGTVGVTYTHHSERPFDVVLERRTTLRDNGVRTDLALALELNGAPARVPIALLGEYRFATGGTGQLEITDAAEHTVGAGIYYSGQPQLQLGVAGSYRLAGPHLVGVDSDGLPASSKPLEVSTGAVVFRYVW